MRDLTVNPALNPAWDPSAERPRLRALVYRMMGTVADAEDVVQEAFARFYRLRPEQRAELRHPGAWLMRVAGRVALDELTSARARRVQYTGEWLPEPVPADSDYAAGASWDPAEIAVASEAVSQALLVLLESLSPAERAVYVLRESFALPYAEIAQVVERTPGACRQLFSVAKQHLERGRQVPVARSEHDDVVRAFAAACESGDLEALVRLLDPGVTVRSDGGGVVSAARRPVVGVQNVSRLLIGLRTKYPEAGVEIVQVPEGAGVVLLLDGITAGLLTCTVTESGVTDLHIMRNPEKLTLW